MLANGDVFAGYVIDRQLGRGGMGSVYLAKHPRLPRMTALKLLNREMFFDKEVRARFEREADLVARLDHPNIVTVYDRGLEDEQLWISMQYIDGIDAASVDPQKLPPERAVQIIAETASALDYAHGMGVMHRDVKPANILLARSTGGRGERVYLTDFGIARLRDDTGHLTQTGTFTATLAYASPEQLTGADLDHRSDQYSLACSLYWLLTGNGPFTATNPAGVIQGHLQSPPPSLHAARPELPPALDSVLAKAMAKRPDDRFTSCSEFAEAAKLALTSPGSPGIPPSLPPTAVASPYQPNAPYSSGANPYPSTAAPQPYAAGTQAQPYASGVQQGQPYASGIQQGQPYASGVQQGQPSYPSGYQQQPAELGGRPNSDMHQQPYGSGPGYPTPVGQPYGGGPGGYTGPTSYPQPMPQVAHGGPPPRKSNTGLIAAICIGLVVLIGVVVGVVALATSGGGEGGDNEAAGTSTQTTVAPVPATADSISKEFPQLVPATKEEEIGYNGAKCWETDDGYTPSPDDGEPDFGKWAWQWRCYGGGDNDDPFYRIYVYDSADEVDSVVKGLPATAEKSSDTNGSRTYTNYKWDSDGPKMVTVFTNHPERAQYLMYTDGIVGTIPEMVTWWKSAPLN
ncbi:serine/threonine-protein kinase [Nocardia carnea]|uniref:serine/threonine-protein kinase n=1 Tax=Nocardia carnea TaxID=37328 RepID=UPI002458C585|nr:serine/threonine protein kinase [Nocardia carnea]